MGLLLLGGRLFCWVLVVVVVVGFYGGGFCLYVKYRTGVSR